ncbi:SEC-C metal-binding domain-containing protein [Bacillus sp. FJAT-27251]|uniref:YecA family protein n=1 Tax=Bacillus sp. FJAT-27251 TaxID=1684142 RepID=UPI0006A7E271|nr:SEC-C metal-binding domain-containing protein [Bacillus sp. FJAT-27251]
MSNLLTEKNQKRVIEALVKLKDDVPDKAEAKRWKAIKHPITLAEALNRLTKVDLDNLRKELDLQGVSSLKKGELVLVLQDEILAGLEEMCKKLDKERFSLLGELVRNNGVIEAPSLEDYQYQYFNDSSIAMTGTLKGKKVLVMPQEIVDRIAELQDEGIKAVIDRNTEYIQLTKGLLFYYGTLTYPALKELLDKHLNAIVPGSDYLPVVMHAASYYREFVLEDRYISSTRVDDPEKVLREHEVRSNVPYNAFTRSQLLKAAEPGYVERSQSYTTLVYYLHTRFEMAAEEADIIVSKCAFIAQSSEGMNEVMEFLESVLEVDNMETVQEIADRVVTLVNNTRKWDLKGYALLELREKRTDKSTSIQSGKKPGRNEPCYCGSGKKYKKCCGR